MNRFLLLLPVLLVGCPKGLEPQGRSEQEQLRMRTPRWGHVGNGGVTLHYRIFGNGPPILLLSGGPGGPSEELRPVAELLSTTHQVILLDQRGTGRSQLPTLDATTINLAAYVSDIETLRRHLGLDMWIVLGHSAGGSLAMATAAEHPEQVSGLILVASAGANLDFMVEAPTRQKHTEEDRAAMQYWSDPERRQAEPERASRELYRAFVSGVVHDRSHTDRVLEHFVPEPHTLTIAQWMMQDMMSSGYDLREPLGRFSGPVLVIQGRDGFMGENTARQIAESFSDATVEIIDHCGHYPMYEQPARFEELVQDFLKRRFPTP